MVGSDSGTVPSGLLRASPTCIVELDMASTADDTLDGGWEVKVDPSPYGLHEITRLERQPHAQTESPISGPNSQDLVPSNSAQDEGTAAGCSVLVHGCSSWSNGTSGQHVELAVPSLSCICTLSCAG